MSLNVREVIKRALRLNGALASGDDPDATDLADALTALNAMQRAWFGTLIGVRMSAQSATGAAGQAENGGEYAIPANAFTLTAPLNPRSGARFGAVDATLDFAANNCVVTPNGRLIEGATSLTLATNGDNRRWWYRGDTGNWIREADYVTANDVIEFPDAVIAYMPYMLSVVLAGETNTDLRADQLAANAEGRQVLARTYGRRGRNTIDPPLGLAQPAPQGG
jgi:hypothetical protein